MESSSNANKMLMMGIVGFVAGILLAPDKGTVTRDRLKSKADELTDKAKEKRSQARGKLQDLRRKKDEVVADMDSRDVDETVDRLVP